MTQVALQQNNASIPEIIFITENPIRECLHDSIPRYITARKDIPAPLKLLIGVLYGRFGNDGHLSFKIKTLAEMTGLSVATVKRAIAKGRQLKIFETINNGRALIFKLIKQTARKIKLSYQKDQVEPPPIIDEKKHLKTTTTESPPKNTDPPPPVPEPQEAKKNDAVILKIRKLIDPKIGNSIGNDVIIKKIVGISEKQIVWASNKAIEKATINKVGYFMTLLNVKIDETHANNLKIAQIPFDIDGDNDKMKKIICYNRNVSFLTCSAIKGTGNPTNECRQYCPHFVSKTKK